MGSGHDIDPVGERTIMMMDDALSQWLKVNMRVGLGGWKALRHLDKI